MGRSGNFPSSGPPAAGKRIAHQAVQEVSFSLRSVRSGPLSAALVLRDGRSITLLDALGGGTLGTVYRGVLDGGWGIRRPVAVKVLGLPAEVDASEVMPDLARVARSLACITHGSVVQLFEIEVANGQPFFVSELVDGESLASVLEGWGSQGIRVPIDFAVVVALRTAEALAAALFTDGIDGELTDLVHGDLSPRQILVSSQGEVKVCDFGLSVLGELASHVRARSRLAYTAPEIAQGTPADARSDVFSLGVILHEMLVGPRFARGTSIAHAVQMVEDGHLYTSGLEPNLPRSLRDVLARATNPDPAARYPHARAMAFDLRREMLCLNLCDAQTCVRHAIVGWCELNPDRRRS
jgi:eukaryotic-like serine/threonine-protein kinase